MTLTDLGTPIATNPAVRVEETSMKDALERTERMAVASGLPIEVMRAFNEILAAAAERIKSRGYFGYVGGDERPVAWSFLAYLPDSPTVLLGGAATLEEYRGHGLYTALVARRIAAVRPSARA